MPEKSLAQLRFLSSAAKRGDMENGADESGGLDMPGHVKKMAHGGYSCMSCGGSVDVDGYGFGGEVHEPPGKSYNEIENAIDEALTPDEDDGPEGHGDEEDEDTHKASLAAAIKRRKR